MIGNVTYLYVMLYSMNKDSKHFTRVSRGFFHQGSAGAASIEIVADHDSGNSIPFSYRTVCGISNVPHKCCERGPGVCHPYLQSLESIRPFADVIAKAALSPQLFKDHECWSGWGLEPATFRMVVRCSII